MLAHSPNRLVKVERDVDKDSVPDDTLATYEYNALHWRTVKDADIHGATSTDLPDGTIDQRRIMFYDASFTARSQRSTLHRVACRS